jgi:hypothetical protein
MCMIFGPAEPAPDGSAARALVRTVGEGVLMAVIGR